MSDSRRRIEALRAKAASTTFPAEAQALRAKADELEASLPPPPVDPGCVYVSDWGNGFGFYSTTGSVTQTYTGITF